jgi:hypothetical protein
MMRNALYSKDNYLSVPEIIGTVFAKTSSKRSFSMTEYERFGLVFTKTRVYKFGRWFLIPVNGRDLNVLKISASRMYIITLCSIQYTVFAFSSVSLRKIQPTVYPYIIHCNFT